PNGIPLIWRDPWLDVAPGGHQYAHPAQHPAAGWTYAEVLVDRADAAAAASLADVPAAGTLALEALRIAAWRPRLSTEVDEKTIPHELDWLRSAVHLNKGCYRGQETVAKVHNLGHPPRRLVMLHLDGSEGVLPAPGDAVLLPSADDSAPTEVGRITSAAIHHELGPIALAVIKRNVDPAADLVVAADGAQVAAAQEVIVPTDAGAEANVPRLPRLGAVRR
ncbi:MAG TPA: glycine cleavage T C-terminal barrel domain-containing protein, partial [Rhodoglobus sp.]|nr:glycine cleavage T C-terminal barrel domain-containing protein [Rhodoglobus sp.]